MSGTHKSNKLVIGDIYSWAGIDLAKREELRPDKIIYNDRTTIVYWNDGTKTVSTCDVNDTFDKKIGFASCLLKKMYGKKVHKKRLFDRMIEGAECHNLNKETDVMHFEFSVDRSLEDLNKFLEIKK